MARLSASARKAIPTSKFAGPGRSFPVEDAAHARAASMLDGNASAATKAKVKAALKKFTGKK
jgi:hypothetical protein